MGPESINLSPIETLHNQPPWKVCILNSESYGDLVEIRTVSDNRIVTEVGGGRPLKTATFIVRSVNTHQAFMELMDLVIEMDKHGVLKGDWATKVDEALKKLDYAENGYPCEK